MNYLERVLGNFATFVQFILCVVFVVAYLMLAPYIHLVLLHLLVMSGCLFLVYRKVKKIRKRIIKYIYVVLERAQNSGRSHPENFDEQEYAPIGFQQQIHPDDLEPEEDYDENREDKFKRE